MRYSIYFLFLLFLGSSMSAQEANYPFMENVGQWEGDFNFKVEMGSTDIYGMDQGIRILMKDPTNSERLHDHIHGVLEEVKLNFHAFDMIFLGGDPKAKRSMIEPSSSSYNYFIGNDQSKWKSNLHRYAQMQIEDVWPGIDLHWKSENAQLKYEWHLDPQSNPELIQIKIEGADKVKRSFGQLVIKNSLEDYIESAPLAYQIIDGQKIEIACRWYVDGDVISYDFPDGYDSQHPIVIDPTLVYCTFTGSTADNWGISATYDASGNTYLGSITSGIGFPMTTGAFQTTYGGGISTASFPCDITISKYNAMGSAMIYSTYVGGNGNELPHSLIVNDQDEVVIAGRSNSTNYPTLTGSYDATHNGGWDIILTKLNATGTALLGSTYLGASGDDGLNINDGGTNFGSNASLKANYGDDARSEVKVDNAGNIYLASSSQSTSSSMPYTYSTSGAKGNQNALVAKFNSNLSNLIWLGNYGGSQNDAAYVIDFDNTESSLFVAGGTESSNLNAGAGSYQASKAGGIDGYIMKVSTTNGVLQNTTYLGTTSYDQIYGIQVDDSNYVYVTGQTLGTWPVSSGVYSNANSAQFIQKLDANLQNSIFSTVFGDGQHAGVNISPVAFLVDDCGAIFVSGWGGQINQLSGFGISDDTYNLPTTTNAIKTTTDGSDFYFIVLSKNAVNLLYGSYFGQNGGGGEHVDGGTSRFDPTGQIFQAICANCSSGSVVFPTTTGAYSTTNNSANCNAAAVKVNFEYTATIADALANPDTIGCAPFPVQFTNQSLNATSNFWDFDDGNTSTAVSPNHTYTTPGVYHPFLATYNPNVCTERDTFYMTIIVSSDSIFGDFTITDIDSCDEVYLDFTQTILADSDPALDPTGFTFLWNFGDGTSSTLANPPTHVYTTQGSYTITLTVTHPEGCNSPFTITHVYDFFNPNSVEARVQLPDSLCLPASTTIVNNSLNATGHYWDFGDGSTSTQEVPTHSYAQPGVYEVLYVASNPTSCNFTDTLRFTIYCGTQPTADFFSDPFPDVFNQEVQFTNTSVSANSFLWDFGDGTTSTEMHPTYTYKESGNFTVCLEASNGFCRDTICKLLSVTIKPLIDITTGFTPNGDGTNDYVEVRGFGIEKFKLMIFNRWGQKIYEVEQAIGGATWDGYFNGELQESDAYAFVLDAQFTDGTESQTQGNISLIR